MPIRAALRHRIYSSRALASHTVYLGSCTRHSPAVPHSAADAGVYAFGQPLVDVCASQLPFILPDRVEPIPDMFSDAFFACARPRLCGSGSARSSMRQSSASCASCPARVFAGDPPPPPGPSPTASASARDACYGPKKMKGGRKARVSAAVQHTFQCPTGSTCNHACNVATCIMVTCNMQHS